MSGHQNIVMTNNWMINVFKAKGFAYEVVKKERTEWALFAKYTGHDQLKRLIQR
jgi:hypothetical protein